MLATHSKDVPKHSISAAKLVAVQMFEMRLQILLTCVAEQEVAASPAGHGGARYWAAHGGFERCCQ